MRGALRIGDVDAPPECRAWLSALAGYLAYDLEPRQRRHLVAHLRRCRRCRTELAELRPVVRAIRSRAPDGRKVMTTPESHRQLRKPLAGIIVAAILLVVAVALIVLFVTGGGGGGGLIEY